MFLCVELCVSHDIDNRSTNSAYRGISADIIDNALAGSTGVYVRLGCARIEFGFGILTGARGSDFETHVFVPCGDSISSQTVAHSQSLFISFPVFSDYTGVTLADGTKEHE
jgi:hypothetical protein